MSYKITEKAVDDGSVSDSSSDSSSDSNVSDFGSTFGDALRTKSLFDETVLPTPEEAISYDKKTFNVDIKVIKERLGLDVYGLMRLVNLVRKESLSPEVVTDLKSGDERLTDNALLTPVIADDPLLQLDLNDSWSDDEEPESVQPLSAESDRVKLLEEQLAKARADLASMRSLLHDTVEENDRIEQAGPSVRGKGKIPAGRDDDTHYFESYAENDIHEIMLKDTTRTLSYAKFILRNPAVFKNAIVLDVGCGTGILSMFAAKAGAKQVFAIEASGLATKARENIKNNGLDGVITVIQSKVEDVELPVKQVDVIVSEWMGYMLLYESMLDSVLHARDRYLAPTGVMAPSQTRLVLSAITGDRVWRERVGFWQGVYGFDMQAMDSVYFEEGLVEYVDEKEMVTDEHVVRDVNTHTSTPKSLDFHSSFELHVQSNATIRAFLTHFDTFFSPEQGDRSQVALTDNVDLTRHEVDEYTKPVTGATDGQTPVSFTTGPRGLETHWRQVAFLLRKPIEVKAGDVILGRFGCRKSATNSRELNVEIHYNLKGEEERTVQAYRVC